MAEKPSSKPAAKGGKTAKQRMAGFSAEERAAMQARARELKEAKRGADGEQAVLAAIAAVSPTERQLCGQLHKLVRQAAPALLPKTWYGMPAYANADDKVVCFFKPASKFKERYLTFGFNDVAKLDAGAMWPTSFALTELTTAVARELTALVKKAAG